MKLTLRFYFNDHEVECEHTWSNLNSNQVMFFGCNALNQDLDLFIKHDKESVKHDGSTYLSHSGSSFSYILKPKFNQHIGSYQSLSLNMPFSNEKEFFMGDSCILRPFNKNFEEDFYGRVEIEILNETDLGLATSLDRESDKDQLLLFFCYLGEFKKNYYKNFSQDLEIEVVQTPRASRKISARELFNDVDKYHQYYLNELGKHKQKRLTIFQSMPDDNFQKLGQGKTFATGENVRNGILIYLPDDENYIEWLSGHKSYLRELKYGLLHELGHFYSSKGGDPEKTLITHSSSCPVRDFWIIGENLNGYFTSIIAKELGLIEDDQGFSSLVKLHSNTYLKRKGYAGCLYFCYVDKILRDVGSSLWDVYKNMIDSQRENPSPYDNIEYFINFCNVECGEIISGRIRELFDLNPEDILFESEYFKGLICE